MLLRFPTRGQPSVATMQALLGRPRCAMTAGGAPRCRGGTRRRPRDDADSATRLRQHPPQVRIAGLGDRATRPLRAARMLRRNQAHKGHGTRGRGEAPGIAESAAMVSAVRSSMPRKHRSRWTPGRNGSSSSRARNSSSTVGAAPWLRRPPADTRDASARGRERPRCARSHVSWGFDQGFLVAVNRRPWRKEFREPMPGAQQIGADVFAATDRSRAASSCSVGIWIAVNAPARNSTASCPASRRSVLIRSPGRRGISAGAITSQGMPRLA